KDRNQTFSFAVVVSGTRTPNRKRQRSTGPSKKALALRRRDEVSRIGGAMKLKAPDDAAATALSPINWFSGICLAAFLTIIYPSTGVAKSGAGELNATEQWVVTQTRAGEIADLSKQFPDKEKDKR